MFGPKLSVSHDERAERVVTPADILGLPDLTGYVRFAGQAEIAKTIVPVLVQPEKQRGSWTLQEKISR